VSEELQALCFLVGANSVFVGEKLLTKKNAGGDHEQEVEAGKYEKVLSAICKMHRSSVLHRGQLCQSEQIRRNTIGSHSNAGAFPSSRLRKGKATEVFGGWKGGMVVVDDVS
jgi:hypothetical protein